MKLKNKILFAQILSLLIIVSLLIFIISLNNNIIYLSKNYFVFPVIILLLVLSSILVLLSFKINYILITLEQLTTFTKQISKGFLNVRLVFYGNDELASLGKEFNVMIEKIEEYRNTTLGAQIRLKKLFLAAIDLIYEPFIIYEVVNDRLTLNIKAQQSLDIPSKNIDIQTLKLEDLLNNDLKNFIIKPNNQNAKNIYLKGINYYIVRKENIIIEENLNIIVLTFKDSSKIDLKGFIQLEKISSFAQELLLPLTSIHMAIHVCLENTLGDLTSKQVDFLSAAREDCYKMRKMITNIQDLQKLEDIANLSIKTKTDFIKVLKECINSMKIISDMKKVKIDLDFPPLLERIYINKNQIALVVNNLIDNAIYHSSISATVQIRVKENKNNVIFYIYNKGSYIAHEFQNQIFEKYFQLPNDKSRRDGLGLYIAKRIIEDHNGTIGVRSSPKLSTTFWFKIPKQGK